jgi:uncharacterized protein YbjT (DUF2867 family)
MKTALIAGATGLVGRQLLDKLLGSDRYSKIIGLSRSTMSVNHPKFSNIISDFHQPGEVLRDELPDDVFCCLGTTMARAGSREKFYEVDFHFPLSLAKATFSQGARQYLLVSALGADKNSSIYYNRVKGEVEEAVINVGFHTVHIFRPSLLLGPRQEKRAGEDAAKWLYKVFSFAIPARYKAISSERVADAMLRAAEKEQQGTFVHESQEMAGELV